MLFTYETDRLILKILKPDFAYDVLDFYNRDKELFEEYELDRCEDFYTVKYQQKVLKYEYNAASKAELFRFYVFRKENPSKIIGTVCIHNIYRGCYRSCEFGYKFSSKYHGYGYASEAIAKCIQLSFEELQLHKVIAVVRPDNISSIRLLENLGFNNDGLHRDELFMHGSWYDHYIFSLLETDFV